MSETLYPEGARDELERVAGAYLTQRGWTRHDTVRAWAWSKPNLGKSRFTLGHALQLELDGSA